MSEAYDPNSIEPKWRERWDEDGVNRVDIEGAENPLFNLMMFPYPSAEGLHIGNVYAFTGADVYGRFNRLRGYDVLEPIGFDAFGIHSENFALKQNTHPNTLIPKNIENFSRQLKSMGFMYDWDRTVNTTDPSYYKWTQWIFLKLYEAGLAEKRNSPVNWCPSCKTVLSNEQVIDGLCERCSSEVTQRLLDQWFFKITQYAERLHDNLDWIDWSESTKRLQRNWIGRSQGAEIDFAIKGHDGTIRVFTTRPDTVFGVSYMVLAPEHPLVATLASAEQKAAVDAYVAKCQAKDLVARRTAASGQEKTGEFLGAYAINPADGKEVPIWIADYVLMEYGHGAVMGVPAHDERDFEFATERGLEILPVVAPEGDASAVADMTEAYIEKGDAARLVNSGEFDGMVPSEAIPAITEWLEKKGAAEAKVNYRLHDWCISRQRYWGPPIPIIYCDDCGTQPVPEADLPVELPHVEDYRPDESGVGPLGRSEAFVKTSCPKCGGAARRETDVSDTFLDSAWYFLRYPSTDLDDAAFGKERTKRWLPVDMYIGGEEHAVLHLMYSRFTTMVLHDLGLLDFEEPYKRFRRHGMIVREGAKMSKSRGNIVNPDAYVEEHGADVVRTYLMFMGPFQEGGDFRDQGIAGISRFFTRLWNTIVPVDGLADGPVEEGPVEREMHATIGKVTQDLEALSYNTAIAALMNYLNAVREGGRAVRKAEVEPLVVMLAPFAPFLAEELWQRLGHERSVFRGSNWPDWDEEKAKRDEIEIAVQVNGKRRAGVSVARGASEAEVVEAALQDANCARFVEGKEIKRQIFVPDRILNLIV